MTLEDIRNRARNTLNDWPTTIKLTEAINSTNESLKVSDGAAAHIGGWLSIGDEILSVYSTTEEAIGVRRGQKGTTAISHAANADIMAFTLFTDEEIDMRIREAFNQIYPGVYRKVTQIVTSDGSRIIDTSDLDYPAPDGIAQIEIEQDDYQTTNKVWIPWFGWGAMDGGILLNSALAAGTRIRLTWSTYWETLEDNEDETSLPNNYLPLIDYYVCGKLGEGKMHLRINFEGMNADLDPMKASAADLLGIAGYDLYQFEKMMTKYKMPALAFLPTRRPVRKRI